MAKTEQHRPTFVITVDVEADNAWGDDTSVTTANAAYLPRFQSLCERHGLRPTYLVDWAMACSPAFQDFGRSVIDRDTAEIGMHLHAWTTPPAAPLTGADHRHKPFLIDFPERVMAEKVKAATGVLENVFQISPVSHRSGRWVLDETYARILVEHGYLVDCSVTPHISWRGTTGAPGGRGPTDYSRFPERPYFVDLQAIHREGDSPLLEVPMTVGRHRRARIIEGTRRLLPHGGLPRRVMGRLFPETGWMRPNGRNRRGMLELARRSLEQGRDHVEFMIHSSELMPGGSPYFRTRRSVEILYTDMGALFEAVARDFTGRTLAEYRGQFRSLSRR